jgi:oligopeptide/dipeptide ABC transporter ATP-binding protein
VATLLEVSDLQTHFTTRHGLVRAVDGVSWDIAEGETVALVGESGCGKSVTALSIMRLVAEPAGRIAGGRILFKGRDLLDLSEEEMRRVRGREIAMIFQEPMTSLNPVLTIGRQLTEGLETHLRLDAAAARARALELLAMVGIPDPARRLPQYPHQFSGGMRQRMMIAMALACDPSLVLADEPTTALDVTIQAQILELMKDLSRRLGVAMLIITHNLGVVARYADRVNVMYAGRIIERGTAQELYGNPRHPYTLGLLRSVPRLDEPRRARLAPIDGQPPDLTRLPPGCAFAPRCAFRLERCLVEAPGLRPIGAPGHVSACWEAERLAREPAAVGER